MYLQGLQSYFKIVSIVLHTGFYVLTCEMKGQVAFGSLLWVSMADPLEQFIFGFNREVLYLVGQWKPNTGLLH